MTYSTLAPRHLKLRQHNFSTLHSPHLKSPPHFSFQLSQFQLFPHSPSASFATSLFKPAEPQHPLTSNYFKFTF